jgi:serine/threonine protein kinase, bacterial
MSYCLNPDCPQPKNPLKTKVCKACGSPLLLNKRYLPVKKIGQGGFGATFLAVDIALPGTPSCVIKQLRPATNIPHVFNMAKELFEREAATLGRVGNHPQVPRLLDYFESRKQFYLVQEFVKGDNLQQEIKRNGPFSEAGIRQFLQEILPMIDYIHSQEVIHRDIKPANIIRREQDKQLVLIDFGAVKNQINTEAAANLDGQTALTSFAVGTPGFAPPEQMAMRPVYASDIYAIGVTCIYLLTGKQPKELGYNSTTGEMLWQKHVSISDHLAQVISKMIEGSVRHRYKCAKEVLDALKLEPYLDSLAQSMVTKTNPPPPPPASSRMNTGMGALNNPNLQLPGQNKAPASASEKLAMQIRSRRSRVGGGVPGIGEAAGTVGNPNTAFNTTPANPVTTPNSPRDKKKASIPATVEAVLEAYTKGRRDFSQLNLNNLNLKQAELSKANFHDSSLIKVNLEKANLAGCDFGKANFSKACLLNANLGRAYLGHTNLSGADLRGADLSFATLTSANLKGANLCGANLANAKVTDEQLEQAKTNWRTTYPNGKRGLF